MWCTLSCGFLLLSRKKFGMLVSTSFVTVCVCVCVHSLTDLDASHNSLTCIPSSLFQLPELSNLMLSYNLLTHLPGDPEDISAGMDSCKLIILPLNNNNNNNNYNYNYNNNYNNNSDSVPLFLLAFALSSLLFNFWLCNVACMFVCLFVCWVV